MLEVADRGIETGRLRQVDHLVAISDRLQSYAVLLLFVAFPGSCVAVRQPRTDAVQLITIRSSCVRNACCRV